MQNDSAKNEVNEFAFGLKEENPEMTWDTVAQRVIKEFPGLSISANAIRKRHSAWKRSAGKSLEPTTCESSESSQIEKLFLEQLEVRLRAMVEKVAAQVAARICDDKFTNFPKDRKLATEDIPHFPLAPPLPETKEGSRKHISPRGKLSGTC